MTLTTLLAALGMALSFALPSTPALPLPEAADPTTGVTRSRRLTLPFAEEGLLAFNAHGAELILQGWDRAELRVDATKRVSGLDGSLQALATRILESIVVRLEREGDRVDLLVEYPAHCSLVLQCSVELRAFAPHRLAVSARYDDAALSISDVHGGIELENDTGDVVLRNVSGRIGVRTRGGDVDAAPGLPAHISIVSKSGDVHVTLPRDPAAEPVLLIRAPEQHVRSEAPAFTTREAYEAALQSGTLLGGGWPRVELRSDSGHVVVEWAAADDR